jgi:aerobic C4-dicarboxylate transport protein
MVASIATAPVTTPPSLKKPFYMGLSFQVLLGVAIATVLGYGSPARAVAMKPLGDAFIRLITMIITLVIFCTLVTGIAGWRTLKKSAASAVRPCCISKWSPRLLCSSDLS